MTKEIIFLLLIGSLGVLSKNVSIWIASLILIIIVLLRAGGILFPVLTKYSMNVGITLIVIGVLIPIASGKVTLDHFKSSILTFDGIAILIAGGLVAVFGGLGLTFLQKEPEITATLILGTIIGVLLFKGIPVGPLIGAGIALLLIKIKDWVLLLFT